MLKLRIISLITALSVLFTLTASLTAFAGEPEEIDVDELMGELGEYTISDSDFAALLSGSDVVSVTDHLSDYETFVFKAKQHKLSMVVPKLDGGFSLNSTAEEMEQIGVSLEEALSYFDQYSGGSVSYLYNSSSQNGQINCIIIYSKNNYTELISDYGKLSDEKLEDIRTTRMAFTNDYPEVRVINGNTYLYACGEDESLGTYTFSLETIVKGGRYQIYLDLTDPTSIDRAAATEMIRSIKIGGLRTSLTGAADRGLVIAMLAALIVLFLIVCLLAFFIIRFAMFSKAAGSKFNIIGFNMPPKKDELEKFAKEQRRAERRAKQSQSKPAPRVDIDRTVSLADSISDEDE